MTINANWIEDLRTKFDFMKRSLGFPKFSCWKSKSNWAADRPPSCFYDKDPAYGPRGQGFGSFQLRRNDTPVVPVGYADGSGRFGLLLRSAEP